MKVFRGLPNAASRAPCALAIGNFDGVHLGHQALLARVCEAATRLQLDAAVSLTATDYNGNTSEIGTCYPIDRIFKDGVEIPTGN
mgnify:CR=1 FL=1